MDLDFKKLEQTQHMLEWLSENPFQEMIIALENMFTQQSATTKLLSFKISGEPEWLTGAKKVEKSEQMVLVRVGLAVPCDFTLKDQTGIHHLSAIFTWVGTDLDQHPKTQMWVDLDQTIQDYCANGKLKSRIYEGD